jgi:hypothetical protein
MLGWWGILFALGVLSFLDTFVGFGDAFRQVISAIFLLVALGLFTRIYRKIREGEKERLTDRIAHLERELQTARVGDIQQPMVPESVDRYPVTA